MVSFDTLPIFFGGLAVGISINMLYQKYITPTLEEEENSDSEWEDESSDEDEDLTDKSSNADVMMQGNIKMIMVANVAYIAT